MAKTPIHFNIDENLLANLRAYAAQSGCTVAELIDRFCQQGLEMASQEGLISTLDAHIGRGKNNILAERLGIVETEIKSILERLSLLESKVDVDIDVNDYLQNWEKSLELRIASLVDTFVEKHVEEILGAADLHSRIGPLRQTIPSAEELDAHQTDLDEEDEPDEILTEFLEPHART